MEFSQSTLALFATGICIAIFAAVIFFDHRAHKRKLDEIDARHDALHNGMKAAIERITGRPYDEAAPDSPSERKR